MTKKTAAILTALLLIFSLAACGGGKVDPSDPNQGLWKATTAEMMGLSMAVEDFFGEGFTVELQSGGKCAINVDGEKANGTWTLAGSAFTLKGGGLDCAGTLQDGLITLENVLDMGMTLVFEKEGAPRRADATPEAEEVSAGDAGYYVLHTYTQGGDTLDAEMLSALGMNYYVLLNEDGTMVLYTDTLISGTWESGRLHYGEGGESVYSDYTLEGDLLSIDLGSADVTLVFKRSSGTPPPPGDAGAGELTELQQYWSGVWYGFMMFNGGTGKYEEGAGDADMYLVVDVDADGNGVFTVYNQYNLSEWGYGICVAHEGRLEVLEGTLSSSPEPMVPEDWTFYVANDAGDKIVNTTDFIDYQDDSFNYSLFFKPWGSDWQEEIDSGRPTYPPGYDEYWAMIEAGMPSPFDEDYTDVGDETAQDTGAGSGGLDDVVVALTFDELSAALEAFDMEREVTTPGDVADYLGAPGLRDDDHSSVAFSVSWYASDNGYATVFFDKESGYYTSWSTSGLGRPEGWEEGYVPTADSSAALAGLDAEAAAGDGGPISYELEGVTVTATLPAAGWSHMPSSTDQVYLYNVPDASQAYSNDPRISIRIADNAETFDFYKDDFEDLKDIGKRTIGGIEMTGRTYEDVGMEWTEYIGKISDTRYVSIRASKVDVTGGEGSGVLDSVGFKQ